MEIPEANKIVWSKLSAPINTSTDVATPEKPIESEGNNNVNNTKN